MCLQVLSVRVEVNDEDYGRRATNDLIGVVEITLNVEDENEVIQQWYQIEDTEYDVNQFFFKLDEQARSIGAV